jgi:arabinose-5-phosphate isomerase
MHSNILKRAVLTLNMEGDAIHNLAKSLDSKFVDAVELILNSDGRVVVTGVGKSADVGRKIVATLNSTGTPAMFVHAGDAVHGDLGGIQKGDVVICLSKSGNSAEIAALVPLLKAQNHPIIAVTGVEGSNLASHADIVLLAGVDAEACPYDLAPTTSTAVQMALGDALALCLMEVKGFDEIDFAKFHPGGTLGKKLTITLADLCEKGRTPKVKIDASLQNILLSMTQGRYGATAVVEPLGDDERVIGIITDGDLRRALEGELTTETVASSIMNTTPLSLTSNELASKAARLIKERNISQILVLNDDGKYIGMVHIHDLVKEGLVN